MLAFVSGFYGKPLHLGGRSGSLALTKMQAAPSTSTSAASPKITLYGTPVSCYAARVRYVISRKRLSEEEVEVRSPMDLGGLKAEGYLKMNPLGKMPAAMIRTSADDSEQCLFESSVICEYVAETFEGREPSFIPPSPEERARARLIANLLDLYVGPHHPYMYKKGFANREEGVKNMHMGFDAIEHAMDRSGPFAVGKSLSIADACLWGNWPFYDYMLPTFFGWSPTDDRPKLAAWVKHMQQESPAAKEVYAQVFEELHKWWDKGRWTDLSMNALTSRPEMSF